MCVFVIREERNEEEGSGGEVEVPSGSGGEVEVPSGSDMRCEVALKVPHTITLPP